MRQILEVLKKAKLVGDYVEPLCCGDDLSDFLEKIRNAKEQMEIISGELQKNERIGCDIPSGLVLQAFLLQTRRAGNEI